uniref:C2H2-type domain-containing protein n=1 Tax=Timema poppense TaxID=170557 RepID=A0A7R9D8H7_TIMPO|nr:unnamed protein product [Timema poppensis]
MMTYCFHSWIQAISRCERDASASLVTIRTGLHLPTSLLMQLTRIQDTGLENVSFSNSSSICKSLEKTQDTLIGACIDENKPGEKTNQSRLTNDIVELRQAGTRKDIFRTKLKLLTHKMSHAKKNVISTCMCKYCNRTFVSTVRLHIHITKMHKEKTRYICDVCNKGFSSANTLEAHKRLHMGIKPYKCDLCEKSYSQSGNLTYHKSTHVGVKSYVCHLCGKAFLTSGILANHERRHTGLKPYICDVCGRAFADNYTLTHHKVVHSGVRSFMCDVCGKVFVHKDTLASHKRIHSGEKKYKCTICNHAFTQMSTMLQHRNTHTGEKSYRCRCGKAFTQQSSLARHKRLHDEEVKSFSCHMCGKKFAYKSTLYKHNRRTHDPIMMQVEFHGLLTQANTVREA